MTFHDGAPFNAAAVKSSFDRVRNPDNHLKRQSSIAMIDHIDVVDDYTVKVTLKYPFGAFATTSPIQAFAIVNPKAIAAVRQGLRPAIPSAPAPTSSSPGSRHAEGDEERALLEAGLAEGGQHHLSSVPENGTRLAMLQAGEAQFIYSVPPEMIKADREQSRHSCGR